MSVSVEIQVPGQAPRVVSTVDLVTSIGRSSRCGIVIDNASVSARHAILKLYSEGVTIEDAGSANGIFLNNQKLTKPVIMENGTSVSLGPGGPTITIVSGSIPQSNSNLSISVSKTGAKKSSMPLAIIVASILLFCSLFAICGVVSIGGAIFAVKISGKSINNAKDQANIERALGKIVVGIEGGQSSGAFQIPFSVGTGFLITSDGYAITNEHVVREAVTMSAEDCREYAMALKVDAVKPKIWMMLGEDTQDAQIVHVSKEYDFALLKIAKDDTPYFKLASSASISRLANVYALGFPDVSTNPVSKEEMIEEHIRSNTLHSQIRESFKASDFQYDSTSGTVSRVRKEQLGRLWIQHNADINGGNSGGPLCLDNGLVIGINTLGANDAHGVFFALAVSQLAKEIDQHQIKATWKSP